MANTKKQVDIVEETVDENINVIEETVDDTAKQNLKKDNSKKAQTKKFGPSDVIPCRSITYGELVLEGYKTKLLYTWANAGDVAYVEYQDLQALQSRKSQFLTDPLFIIEDEALVSQWSNMLKPIYDKIVEEDIEKILDLPADMLKSRISSSPNGVKEAIKNMAAAKIVSGEFDSINKIKVIDEALGTELINMIV